MFGPFPCCSVRLHPDSYSWKHVWDWDCLIALAKKEEEEAAGWLSLKSTDPHLAGGEKIHIVSDDLQRRHIYIYISTYWSRKKWLCWFIFWRSFFLRTLGTKLETAIATNSRTLVSLQHHAHRCGLSNCYIYMFFEHSTCTISAYGAHWHPPLAMPHLTCYTTPAVCIAFRVTKQAPNTCMAYITGQT